MRAWFVGLTAFLASFGTAQAATPGWSILPTGNGSLDSVALTAVSCVSSSACSALGDADSNGFPAIVAQQWNGTAWQLVPATGGNAEGYSIGAVSCISTTSCFAPVEDEFVEISSFPQILGFGGSRWRPVAAPNVTGRLNGVSCPTASFCLAVGWVARAPLVERFNGRRWSRVKRGLPKSGRLEAVSCTAPNRCEAVGSGSGHALGFAARWNGRRLTVQSTPTARGRHNAVLSGVSCATVRACIAVGSIGSGHAESVLAERFNGRHWRSVPVALPTGAHGAALSQVSCSQSRACMAVGSYGGSRPTPLAVHWDGVAFTDETLPSIPGGDSGSLYGVSCPASTWCAAVGSRSDSVIGIASLAMVYR